MTASTGSAEATPAPTVYDIATAPTPALNAVNDSLIYGHLPQTIAPSLRRRRHLPSGCRLRSRVPGAVGLLLSNWLSGDTARPYQSAGQQR